MRKIIIGTFVSLDGVMQAPGGEGGFEHGAWQIPYFDADAGRFMSESFAETYGLLLGRVTYEILAASWPAAPIPDGRRRPARHRGLAERRLVSPQQ